MSKEEFIVDRKNLYSVMLEKMAREDIDLSEILDISCSYDIWTRLEKIQFGKALYKTFRREGGLRIIGDYRVSMKKLPNNHPAREGYEYKDIGAAISDLLSIEIEGIIREHRRCEEQSRKYSLEPILCSYPIVD